MKIKNYINTIIVIFILFSFFQIKAQEEEKQDEYHHCLAEERSFSIGVGIPFSFELNTVGINTRFYYNTGENFCFGPEFTFFKKNEVKIWSLDLVVHYIFEIPGVGLYPVAGVNFTNEIEEHHGSEFAVGFLWGAGVHRNIKKFTVFVEYTRIESALRDQFITAGLIYRLKLNEHGKN